MLSQSDLYYHLHCGEAWMASGPDEWPTVVTLYNDSRKSQPAVPTPGKGLNFYTQHADKFRDFYSSWYSIEVIK